MPPHQALITHFIKIRIIGSREGRHVVVDSRESCPCHHGMVTRTSSLPQGTAVPWERETLTGGLGLCQMGRRKHALQEARDGPTADGEKPSSPKENWTGHGIGAHNVGSDLRF